MSFKFKVAPRFERNLRQLKKRYPQITADLTVAFAEIEINPEIGDVIPKDFAIRKLRIASRDMKRGKSGGFRLLYKLLTDNNAYLNAVLLYIYAKSGQEDVSNTFLEILTDDLADE